ncbi:MAG: hypothetical protein P8X63_05115 [Desulfuromonadaceae bacterium]
MSSNEYLSWLPPQQVRAGEAVEIDGDIPLPVIDNRKTLLCPEEEYRNKFGLEDYGKIKEIRAWLGEHPQGGRLLAYLMDKDPYCG